MGLHLNYELRLPVSTPTDDVSSALSRLRELALDLPFKDVSPLYPDVSAAFPTAESANDALRVLAGIADRTVKKRKRRSA